MTAETSSPKSEQPDPAQIPNVGVAIVGGGIAGLYCAFKIKRKLDKSDEDYSREFEAKFNDGDNKEGDKNKIFLFEASPRLGGRICTRRRPDLAYTKMPPSEGNAQDQPKSASETTAPQQARNSQEGERDFTGLEFYAEFGPMRIEKDQILLHQLLEDLEIEKEKDETKARLVPFPAFGSPVSKHEPKYELIGAENDQKTPWDLMLLAFARIVTGLRVSEKPTLREEELNRGTSPGQSEEAIQKKKETIQKERECLQRQLKDVDERLERAGSPILADPSLWKRNLEDWIGSLEEPHYQNLREYATFDGEPLWNIGFWNLLSDVLSHDAVMKLRDLGTFYHLIPENPNAAEWLIFWLRNIKGSKALKGIFGGMECITEELEKRLEKEPKVEIHRNHKLIRIKPDEEPSSRILLTFELTPEHKSGERVTLQYRAKHVILALPKAPLEKLALTNKEHFPDKIVDHLEAVFGFPMVKLFVVVKRRWWEEEYRANLYATRVPTRELHYWKSPQKDSRKGMIMMYTDRPASSFWANYVKQPGKQEKPECETKPENESGWAEKGHEKSNRLIRKIVQYLRENDVETITSDNIEWYGIRDWGREPYLAANHAWRPERTSWTALKALSQFHLLRPKQETNHKCGKGCPVKNVHICGEAYSDYHGFIEGSLRSSRHVLHVMYPSYFKDTRTPWLCECEHCENDTSRKKYLSHQV